MDPDKNSLKLNILIQCNELAPHSSGGIGMQTLNMANALHAAGHQITIVGIYNDRKTHDHPFKFIQLKRVKKLGFLGHLINVFRLQFFLFHYIRNNKVDLIEYPDYEGYGCFSFAKTPRVIRLNHPGFYIKGKYAGAKWYEITKRLRWLMIRRSINKADRVIAVAEYLVPIVKTLSQPKKIDVIYNLTKVFPTKEFDKNTSISKKYVLNFGTVARHKGSDLLVTAFMKIAHQLSFDLLLVGRIADQNILEIAKDFHSPKKGNSIIFMGELPQTNLMPFIQESKAVIFPSLQENMPLAWTEAMGMGKVLWVSDIPVAKEMITNGIDGFIFEKENIVAIQNALLAIEKIAPSQLEQLSQNARTKYQDNFSTIVLQTKNINCFRSVIEQ